MIDNREIGLFMQYGKLVFTDASRDCQSFDSQLGCRIYTLTFGECHEKCYDLNMCKI